VVAEIELESPAQAFFRPAWLAEEVSHDPRYRNSELSVHPYSEWSRDSSTGGAGESSSSP
jgi:adenylate cyclase